MNCIDRRLNQSKAAVHSRPRSGFWQRISVAAAVCLSLSAVPTALAEPIAQVATPEVDGSVSRDYESAIVYLPDPQTQQLVPRSVLVAAEEPVAGAVEQIVESYEGQNIGITDYDVEVNSTQHEAAIHFEVDHPRGAAVFQSLSSANQYALLEAIRETLLTQPTYEIEQVIFMANGVAIDI